MNTKTSDSISPAEQQRLHATIENWKRKLLDVSKRNRSLNFRPLRSSNVSIVESSSKDVFSKLWIDGVSMRFVASELPSTTAEEIPENSDEFSQKNANNAQSSSNQQIELLFDTQISEIITDNSLYLNSERETRRSNALQVSLDTEKLDRALRRLDEQTRLAIEEQGVNILFLALGMLHYKESADSSEIFKAPLVLLPVEISRKSSNTGYVVTSSGDEPIVNLALTEYLRRSYGISLPELTDSASMNEDFDLNMFFSEIQEVVKGKKDWFFKDEVHLSLFSFQKLMMYKDIEQYLSKISSHRLIHQMIFKTGIKYNGLPAEIQLLDLDKSLPPENTFQVVDADSSQLRAIAAVANMHDLVMEGPPGTGKSQTITNLIALALATGRSVLFVAEKNAALQVVHQRLVKAGLGDFCLELHSTKANKRAVVRELARSLDASLHTPSVSTSNAQRLPSIREKLTTYVKELHKPFSLLEISPYQVFGNYEAVVNAPRYKYSGDVENITSEQLSQIIQNLRELASAANVIGNPLSHPWRDTTKSYYSEEDFEQVEEFCNKILEELKTIYNLSGNLTTQLGFHSIGNENDVHDIVSVADVISRSPGAPSAILASDLWNTEPPSEAIDLIGFGKNLFQRIETINSLFKTSVYEHKHSEDIAYVQEKLQGVNRFIAIFDRRYRTIRNRWLSYRLHSYRGSIRVQAEHLKRVDYINIDREWLEENQLKSQEYFGELWKKENSNWDDLKRYIDWVVEFRSIFLRYNLQSSVIAFAQLPKPDTSAVLLLEIAVKNINELLGSLGKFIGWAEGYLIGEKFEEIEVRIRLLIENLHQAHQWIAFLTIREQALRGISEELVKLAMNGQYSFSNLPEVFQRGFYQKWLSTALQARPPLIEFNTLFHEQRVAEFKEVDRNILIENRDRLIRKVRDDVQKRLQEPQAIQSMAFLRREIAKQRGLSPLRRTINMAGNAIRAIKPCFMMSPLTVAQLLDSSQPDFDLVIFDEASQLPAEDAIGAIVRGKQLVVVGDPKQLPPTNFFGVMNGQVSGSVGEDGLPIYEDGESVLEELMAAGFATSRLKWHYRSAHESLIHFSNVSFYDGDLYTFPSVEYNSEELGVTFEYVENGLYEGKGLNLNEARKVVDAIERHAKLFPKLSLGVGTFNVRQQLAIQDEIENRRRLNPELEAFCSGTTNEPFFVKNLENIQGDERDVIMISVTYGKGNDGRLRYNFGPINGENGWRRLNVLASRAKRHMKVFSSIRADDISLVGLTSEGALLLRNFLDYAENRRIDQTRISHASATESPFEHEVYMELTRRGIKVVPQVGVAGYRVDLGIVDDDFPGRYICGIECDGFTYHASETARDRDRLRQQVLEDRGWIIYRIWSTDWFKDRQGQISRVLDLIQKAREKNRSVIEERIQSISNNKDARKSIQDVIDDISSEHTRLDFEDISNNINENVVDYVRPVVPPYTFAIDKPFSRKLPLLETSNRQLTQTIVDIVSVEGPIHIDDLVERVVEFWNTKAGRRIVEKIKDTCINAWHSKKIIKKNDFLLIHQAKVLVRSRLGIKSDPERIFHKEYREAVLLVLNTGYTFSRKKLTDEVRGILGFGRTTAILEDLIGQAIDELLKSGVAGDASSGITLRN